MFTNSEAVARFNRARGGQSTPEGFSLVGIRTPNSEEDLLGWMIGKQGEAVFGALYPGITVPSRRLLIDPIHRDGCLILKPQWAPLAYGAGLHRGRKAFVQKHKMLAWRDDNHNGLIDDLHDIEPGYFGANMHDMPESWDGDMEKLAESASAGCQVFLKTHHLQRTMFEARVSGKLLIDYTLVMEMTK